MAKCANKNLDVIRDNYNEWYTALWAKNDENRDWFEDTNEKLHYAFKHLTNADRPSVPARPARLTGNTVAALAVELSRVTQLLIDYGIGVVVYADIVDALSSADCRQKTQQLLSDLKAETRKMQRLPSPPTNNNNPVPLCSQYSKWSKGYFDWSVAFRDWEHKLADCVKPTPATAPDQKPQAVSSDAQSRRLQVSPVPWPPWIDYEDE